MRLWFSGEESGCWGLSFTYSSEGIYPKLQGNRRGWGDEPSPLGCGALRVREGDRHREALPSRLLTAEWGGAVGAVCAPRAFEFLPQIATLGPWTVSLSLKAGAIRYP